jgi:hypothetical protein
MEKYFAARARRVPCSGGVGLGFFSMLTRSADLPASDA